MCCVLFAVSWSLYYFCFWVFSRSLNFSEFCVYRFSSFWIINFLMSHFFQFFIFVLFHTVGLLQTSGNLAVFFILRMPQIKVGWSLWKKNLTLPPMDHFYSRTTKTFWYQMCGDLSPPSYSLWHQMTVQQLHLDTIHLEIASAPTD